MKNIALSGSSEGVHWIEGWLTCQENVWWLKHEGLNKDVHQSFWFLVCFCSDLADKMCVHICMLSRAGSSFYWHGVSSEESLHYPNSDRSQEGRKADVAPLENHHIAFQSVLTADSLSLLLHPPGRDREQLDLFFNGRKILETLVEFCHERCSHIRILLVFSRQIGVWIRRHDVRQRREECCMTASKLCLKHAELYTEGFDVCIQVWHQLKFAL